MKSVDKNKQKKSKNKSKPIPKQKVLIVAQELKFARLLAGNEKKSRDRVLKALKKWLLNCFEKNYEFKEDDFVRVWKGLFYAVWMSDKPLIQEELCENISETLDLFPAEQYRHALMMMKAGLRVLATEWYGIDQHRMDKFLMLVRRYLRGCFRAVGRQEWSVESCRQFADMLSKGDGLFATQTPLYARNAISLLMHICDCYLEEIAKTSRGKIPALSLVELLGPFLGHMWTGTEPRVTAGARRMLNHLLRQSDAGLEYEARRRVWERMGCPEGGPDALERESDDEGEELSDDEDDDDIGALDPRAGRVSTCLPLLPARAAAAPLAASLRRLQRAASSRHHLRVRRQAERFEALARGEYPLKLPPARLSSPPPRVPPPSRTAAALARAERALLADPTDMAIRGLSRKHRKRLLAKSRAGHSIVDELDAIRGNVRDAAAANGNWRVEETDPVGDPSNKENRHKKTKKRPTDERPNASPPKKLKLDTKNKEKNKTPEQTDKQTLSTKDSPKEKPKKAQKLKIIVTDSKKDKTPETLKKRTPKEKTPVVVVNKVKHFQKQISAKSEKPKVKVNEKPKNHSYSTPKKVKFVLKNNSMQETMDYYKSVRQSPSIPYDGTKKPAKTNLKPNSTPSPINPFFKKKLRMKN